MTVDGTERISQPKDSVVNKWTLRDESYVSVIRHANGVRVYISTDGCGNGLLTSNRIEMIPGTWSEFCDKLIHFNVVYSKASYVANNQLFVACDGKDEYCHLQQIYRTGDYFTLKSNYVKLDREQLEKLIEIQSEVSECVLDTFFHYALPKFVLNSSTKCNRDIHFNQEQAKDTLCNCIFNELRRTIVKQYECLGCIHNHPSQRRHECLMRSEQDKYFSLGESSLLHLNLRDIASDMTKNYCVCMFTNELFASISLDDFKEDLNKRLSEL